MALSDHPTHQRHLHEEHDMSKLLFAMETQRERERERERARECVCVSVRMYLLACLFVCLFV